MGTSCKDDNDSDSIDSEEISEEVFEFVSELMNEVYFWYSEVEDIDYKDYTEPQDYMDALKYSVDKWSFIDKLETITASFEYGEQIGYGFYLGWDDTYQLRVILSYENSTAYGEGIRKGWILDKIDDVSVKNISSFDDFFNYEPGTMKFLFIDESNSYKTITLTKETYNQNAVHNTSVFDVNGTTVGYLAFDSFLDYSETELTNAYDFLKSELIDELIVDLRFNGGGSISIAHEMANVLVPSGNVGNEFFSTIHNDNYSRYWDTTYTFASNSSNLNLSRIFFITNEYSASASELVINGLEPYMNVIQIGNTTAGKPFAMYGFQFDEWLAYPVTAQSVNADGFGDYTDGLIPDKEITDNYAYNWGDENDPAIQQAINYIRYGNFDAIAIALKGTNQPKVLKGSAIFGRNLLLMDR
jgi:C-terminal processing protease CtpA/Prc